MRLLKEEKIYGVYEVEQFLGEGGIAEVYRVHHKFLGRQALKIFKRTTTNYFHGKRCSVLNEIAGQMNWITKATYE